MRHKREPKMEIVTHEISKPLVCVVQRYGQVFSCYQHGVNVLSLETHITTGLETTYPLETAEVTVGTSS